MKWITLLCAIVLFGCKSKSAQAGDSDAIDYDGIYQSAVQTNPTTGDQSTSYLRFYEDGTVINVSSSGTADQVKSWFEKGHDNVLQGTYQLTGNHLAFTIDGSVQYSGDATGNDQLQLHVKSPSNGQEDDVTYSLVQ